MHWYQRGIGLAYNKFDLDELLQICFVATLVEAVSGRFDNLTIALAAYVFVKSTEVNL